MTQFDIYVFTLCVFVFLLLGGVLFTLLAVLLKQQLRIINSGLNDERIKTEYAKSEKNKKADKVFQTISTVLSCFVLAFAICTFTCSSVIRLSNNNMVDSISIKVVESGSMSYKHKKNEYLTLNNLNNQIDTFDLVIIHKLPAESELKKYDIVVYEVDGNLIFHRITNIEEPNEKHPTERYFVLQGDANENPDKFPVKYSQMKGIYRNEKIPFVGSFIMFMQSPAGYFSLFLILVAFIATPIIEKKLQKATDARLAIILENPQGIETVTDTETITETQEVIVDEDIKKSKKSKAKKRSFEEKLRIIGTMNVWYYQQISEYLCSFDKVKKIRGQNAETYMYKGKTVAKIMINGKILNVYLALNPNDYHDSVYVFDDVSSVKAYSTCPMLIKLTSKRKVDHTEELIKEMFDKAVK